MTKYQTSMITIKTTEYENGIIIRSQSLIYDEVSIPNTDAVIEFLERAEKGNTIPWYMGVLGSTL